MKHAAVENHMSTPEPTWMKAANRLLWAVAIAAICYLPGY